MSEDSERPLEEIADEFKEIATAVETLERNVTKAELTDRDRLRLDQLRDLAESERRDLLTDARSKVERALVEQRDRVKIAEGRAAEAEAKSQVTETELQRLLRDPQVAKAKIEAEVARYKIDKDAEIALKKMESELRVAQLQTDIKRLEGENALAVAKAQGETQRAVAAETSVERLKVRGTVTGALIAATAAVVGALLGSKAMKSDMPPSATASASSASSAAPTGSPSTTSDAQRPPAPPLGTVTAAANDGRAAVQVTAAVTLHLDKPTFQHGEFIHGHIESKFRAYVVVVSWSNDEAFIADPKPGRAPRLVEPNVPAEFPGATRLMAEARPGAKDGFSIYAFTGEEQARRIAGITAPPGEVRGKIKAALANELPGSFGTSDTTYSISPRP